MTRSRSSRPPLACGLALIRRSPCGREGLQVGDQPPGRVEQLLGPVAAHPLLEQRAVPGVGAGLGQRHLVGAQGALDREAVDHLRPGPALRGAQHDHRPRRDGPPSLPAPPAVLSPGRDPGRALLDGRDVVQHLIEGGGELLVDRGGSSPVTKCGS